MAVTLTVQGAVARLVDGATLTRQEMASVTRQLLLEPHDGGATPAQVGALLAALRQRGEAPQELAGVVDALREQVLAIRCDDSRAVDTCGTGGDGAHTLNISTIAAFVVAGCGVTVAKHGNRASSSRCGSADVLDQLGVRTDAEPPVVERCLAELGIAFLFAPRLHPVLRHVGAVRRELGIRTIFNLAGPLANPARVRRQVVGVFEEAKVESMARALGELGAEDALVVWGSDEGGRGTDELSVVGATRAARWRRGALERFTLHPDDFGLPVGASAELAGGDPATNAAMAIALLQGTRKGSARTAVVMTAAAALVVAGQAPDWHNGARLAESSIDGGAAWAKLQELSRMTAGDLPR
jgi:anthranilate phosphoribosyltransferase